MRIFLSAPYTAPDPCVNVHKAIRAANALLDAGHAVFVPHLSHLWHTVTPRPYADWMRNDIAWLQRADAVVRLPGESPGADLEVDEARALNIPVYFGIDEFLKKHKEGDCL